MSTRLGVVDRICPFGMNGQDVTDAVSDEICDYKLTQKLNSTLSVFSAFSHGSRKGISLLAWRTFATWRTTNFSENSGSYCGFYLHILNSAILDIQ